LKRSWSAAFAVGKEEDWLAPKGLCFKSQHRIKYSPKRKSVTRQEPVEEEKEDSAGLTMVFVSTPVLGKNKRVRKVDTPVVQPQDRRFTRSYLKEGYRPAPVVEVQPKKKFRGRAKLLVVQTEAQ
jgi:hypothetical protein